MSTIAKYMLMYAVCYVIFVLIDWAVSGTIDWFYCAALLLMAELFRVFVGLFAPGHEARSVQKYGMIGRRLAQKLRKTE
jgi:hypothetical protein